MSNRAVAAGIAVAFVAVAASGSTLAGAKSHSKTLRLSGVNVGKIAPQNPAAPAPGPPRVKLFKGKHVVGKLTFHGCAEGGGSVCSGQTLGCTNGPMIQCAGTLKLKGTKGTFDFDIAAGGFTSTSLKFASSQLTKPSNGSSRQYGKITVKTTYTKFAKAKARYPVKIKLRKPRGA